MLDALNITEEEALGLAELAQHDLALARDFARRAQAAEDADEASRLGRSYQRAARSYRQTLALKARLRRELAQADAALAQARAATPKARPGGAAVARRIAELRAGLLRLAWDEAERREDEIEAPEGEAAPGEVAADGAPTGGAPTERRLETFTWVRMGVEGVVAEECLKDSFVDETLDDHVARLGLALGYDPEAIPGWRDLPDPPPEALDAPMDDDFDWRSSA